MVRRRTSVSYLQAITNVTPFPTNALLFHWPVSGIVMLGLVWGGEMRSPGGQEDSSMFGKKKSVNAQVRDFHCAFCGLDCSDDDRLTRHVRWAHPGSWAARPEKKEPLVAPGKKA